MYKLNSFKISNFRSFLSAQKLDFTKSNIMAIYGQNASGKSNTAYALDFAKWFILNSANAGIVGVPFDPFLLRDKNDVPTEFEFEFVSGERSFRYVFSYNSEEIVGESLVELTSQKEKVVFAREGQSINNLQTARRYGFTENLLNKTRKNTLLITKAREDNNEYANIVFDFLEHFMAVTCGKVELRQLAVSMLNSDPTMKERVLGFMRSADFWIRDFQIDEIDTPEEVIKTLPFKDDFKNQHFLKSTMITTTHSVRDKENKIVSSKQFSLENQESAGTRIIFDLATLIVYSIEHKSILYIDEFGVYLHPDICTYILNKYRRIEDVQLIINTQDSTLMNSLKREEIVFVDKNQAEESRIVPLTDLSPRADDPFEKHYRKGLYGARPMVVEEVR